MPKRKKSGSLHRTSVETVKGDELERENVKMACDNVEDVEVEEEEEGEELTVIEDEDPVSVDVSDPVSGGGGGGGGKKARIAGLYRPLTHDELRTLKETQSLYQSNLMRLQITELLDEVRLFHCEQLDKLLSTLRSVLLSLPSTSPVNLSEAVAGLPQKIHYPLSLDPSAVKGKFVFHPPSAVKVVGSYLLKTVIQSNTNVDIVLHIPLECLQGKDHLNYRYLHKRALYLCHVAARLREKKRGCGLKKIQFGLSHGGPLLPILILTPDGSRYTIKLHTTISEAPFKPAKLVPNRNNLRRHSVTQLPADLRSLVEVDEGGSSDEPLSAECSSDVTPTPHYNSLVLSEMGGMERHLSDVYAAMQECPAIVDAVILFKVWAKQRSFDQGCNGFTGFHFSLLLTLLLHQRKITPLMSSYQILRVALQTIALSDWSNTGVSMATQDSSLPPLSIFHLHYSVVFLDSSGLLNILSHLSYSRYSWLRHEAAVSIAILDNAAIDGFAALFMTPVTFELKFDLLIHISPVKSLYSYLTGCTAAETLPLLLDGGSWPLPLILERILSVLKKGLGKRVKLLTLQPLKPATQWVCSKRPKCQCDHVTVGVALDPDHAYSLLEMGPPADSKEAGEFRGFWGERSELRRFQDGSINEAVVWRGESVAERRGIVVQIVTHLLNRHFGVPVECVTSSAGVLNTVLSLPLYHPQSTTSSTTMSANRMISVPVATGEEEVNKIEEVFSDLSKQLRGLKGLPLAINSIQGTSAEFRHCAVFPATPWSGRTPQRLLADPLQENQSHCFYPSCDSIATPPFVPTLDVVLQLEGSGKWPTELAAISSVKTAFYTFLSRALQDQCQMLCSPTKHYLDVLKSAYVFRLRIYYPRELVILRETVKSHEASSNLKKTLSDMERELIHLPLLTSTLHGLSLQYSAFGPGARLCKRWISSHMMSNHISDEAIELMVAHIFLQPQPFTPPCSPETVLLRFLFLLSTRDWETDPLVLDIKNELSVSEFEEMRSQLLSKQQPTNFLLTVVMQKETAPFILACPSFPVLHRLCLLAKESMAVLSSQLSVPHSPTIDFKQVFRTSLIGFNVLIYLNKKCIPLLEQGIDVATETSPSHNTKSSQKQPTHFPIANFNPVENYLAELQSAFSDFCLFFYDKYGGQQVAGVWKPAAFVPRPFSVLRSFCKKKISQKKSVVQCVPDVEAVTGDFKIMGKGLVSAVKTLLTPPVT